MKINLWKLQLLFGLVLGSAAAENTNFETTHFSGSGNCVQCHNGMKDPQGNDVSIETAWKSTMMANATKDPLWRAKVRSELNRNPQLSSVINDKCSKCHAPMANTESHIDGAEVKIFDDGFTNPNHKYHDAAMNGISCTVCHQIEDNGKLGTLAGQSGKYSINMNREIYGQYADVATGPMRNNVNYDIMFASHTSQSKMCATCHNLKTPFVDENGNVLSTTPESEFPEQMPYSEWENSSYKDQKSCQDCHMKHVDGVRIATRPNWANTQRDGFAQHMFVGGNKLMLDVLNNNKTILGVTANSFDEIINESDNILKSAANIETVSKSLNNGTLELQLKVNSTTGHKLPTSFPSRRAILHVTVKDDAGNIVFESGKVNADGSVVGSNSDSDRTTYEPHYDLITSESQVQIYETVMGNNLDEVTYTLLRGMKYKKDNRILPIGFDKANAHSDIKVMGAASTDDNFIGGSDTITYSVSGLSGGNYTVTTELLYQTLAKAWAEDLFTDSSTEAASFKTMFDASSMKTTQITQITTSVSGSGGTTPPPTAACDDGIDNDGDGLIDMADSGCTNTTDNDEYNAPIIEPACNDGIDNDGDGLVDLADSGCANASDDDEYNAPAPLPACNDGIDNDGDGLVDLADTGCADAFDNDEYNAPITACNDGVDNDGDGLVDLADSGCTDATDNDEFNAPEPVPTTACSDGIDNDGDGLTDLNDPGCANAEDNDEWNRGRGGRWR